MDEVSKPRARRPVHQAGSSVPAIRHRLVETAGLSEQKLASIGAIAVLASHAEHFAERAIWALDDVDVKGVRPRTDARPISELIKMLREHVPTVRKPGLAPIVERWCDAAELCFSCRNSIMHGTTAYMDSEWTIFGRNSPTGGVKRKKDPTDFHASPHTLAMLEEAFGYVLHVIHFVWTAAQTSVPIGDISEIMIRLSRARSMAAELDNLAAAVNHERY
ncbi:hypothetical protein [Devosia sp. LjRoot3]|uniref:hypothetical protein n=1 Tax=Devosia sp. LjRoot3 TaxID=3342319 RepID=UPI003ECF3993